MYITNNNYQLTNKNRHINNPINFKGTVDKSVINYLKQVQKDVTKTKGNGKIDNIEHAYDSIFAIYKRLTHFMSQTNPDTKLVLKRIEPFKLAPFIKNGEIEIPAYSLLNREKALKQQDKEITTYALPLDVPDIKKPQFAENILGYMFGKRQPHKADDLKGLDKFSDELTKNITPEYVDKIIQEAEINCEYTPRKISDDEKLFQSSINKLIGLQ